MSAASYPITFGYKATDGYYYGPNGRVGKYHRGNDRACPTGTPIIIGGQTIGLTGATGLVSGPHLHTQACTAGSNYANDLDPSPFEFKFGTVVGAGWHNQFGNHVIIRVGGVDITYAHLSKINVSVGQTIGEEMITKDDIGLLRIGHSEIGGWGLSETHAGKFDQQFMNAWLGKPVKEFIWAQWNADNAGIFRNRRVSNEARIRELEAALAVERNKPPKEVIKEVIKIVEKPVEVVKIETVYTHDEATKENVSVILKVVNSIKGLVLNLFKRR